MTKHYLCSMTGMSGWFAVNLLLVSIICSLLSRAVAAAECKPLHLGATTTTYDSGLLGYLLNLFTLETNVRVIPIVTGSGQALRNAKQGDVDILLVHSPEAELAFMLRGYGAGRYPVMHNNFIFVGPIDDPAQVAMAPTAAAALLRVYHSRTPYISRDDDSGTYHAERSLWLDLQLTPSRSTYIRVGAGMGRALQMADQMQAYTLVDRGTWLKYRHRMSLVELFGDKTTLLNQYSLIVAGSGSAIDNKTDQQVACINKFRGWLIGERGQSAIKRFRVDKSVAFIPEMFGD